MNYLTWNKLIGKYFFNPSSAGKEVFLYSSKAVIIEVFKTSSHYDGFVADLMEEYEVTADIEQKIIDQEVWADYCKALRIGPLYTNKLKGWFEKVDDCWQLWDVNKQHQLQGVEIQYPLYLAYLVTLILPLTENEDDFSSINYYDRAVNFLNDNDCFNSREKSALASNYESFRTSFSNQFRLQDHLWYGLSKWAIQQKNGQWGRFNVKIIGGFSHVGKAFGECIITRHQRQLIPLLFEKGNLQVGESLPAGLLKSLLANHGQSLLRYPAGKWQTIIKDEDLLTLLLDIVQEAYEAWTGSVRPDYGQEKETAPSQSVFNIYLSLGIDRPNATLTGFNFRFFQPDQNTGVEDMEFVYRNQTVSDLTFYHRGWAKRKTPLPEAIGQVLDQRIIYQDSLNQLKAIHTPATAYLFSADPALNDFNSRTTLAYNGEYYLLCKNTVKTKVEDWLGSCESFENLGHYHNLPAGWCFYVLKNPATSCAGLPKLTLPAGTSVEKIEGMRMEGNTFLHFWPVRYFINGLKPGEAIYAYADNQTKKELQANSAGCYEVSPADFTVWQKFQIQTSDGTALGPWSHFQECILATDWQEPGLDAFGFADSQDREIIPLRGLQVTQAEERYAVALAQLYYSTLGVDQPLAVVNGTYDYSDILLYTISCRSAFDTIWFATAYENCARDAGITAFGSREVKRALYYYHQLGFLNYDYLKDQRKHLITMNRPAFLNLPVKVAVSSHYQVLLTGARTPDLMEALLDYCQATPGIFMDFSVQHDAGLSGKNFLPQVVVLRARNREVFVQAAAAMNITYQPGIYYPLSLVKHAPSIRDFEPLLPGLALPTWQDYAMTKTFLNPETLEEAKTTVDIDTRLNLVEYYPGTYQSTCILWQEGQAYEIDKNWGKYYVLFKKDCKNKLRYRAATGELFVPVSFGLPKILARALCLMSGLAPAFTCEDGIYYHVYRLPDQLEWNIMNDKLNQRNRI